ncbi:MAG: phosphatidylserine decarboxylase family protein [Candidatus Hydrogenedentes bacterium]|nr:phosphatidylserine decarboxylase family protein [Candidatus Hydrogenedentota bacterium]
MNRSFSAWKEGLPYYGPVLALGVMLTVALGFVGAAWVGGLVLLLGVAMMLFFRDFEREITAASQEVVSPADGTVVAIEDLADSPHYEGPTRRISIFLSVFNVHVNRMPFGAVVKDVRYAPGQFLDARKAETSQVNESNAVWLETPRGPMTVRQISGAVARRIVCPIAPGARFQKGERFGMIRFGSRTELYLPPNTEVCVKLRDKVHAGTTIIARFSHEKTT